MQLFEVVRLLGAAVGGGALATLLTFSLNSRKQKISEFGQLIEKWKEITDDQDDRIKKLEERVEYLEGLIKEKDKIIEKYEKKYNIS